MTRIFQGSHFFSFIPKVFKILSIHLFTSFVIYVNDLFGKQLMN